MSNIRSREDYQNNLMVTDAVARRLSIIGEALSKAIKLNSTINVSHDKKIIALRQIIVHNYDLIDDNTIWAIVKVYLPILKIEIEELIEKT